MDIIPELIALEQPHAWPKPLVDFLEAHHQLFLDWEDGGSTKVSAATYDQAIYGLANILGGYAIRGWHCTRLTEEEIMAVERAGMQLPDPTMLERRIDAVVAAGGFSAAIGAVLKSENQAHEPNRAKRVWFVFFRPGEVSESGIGDFFRYWGGEALYNSHDGDPKMAAVLGIIGRPCLIEADVPIASLGSAVGLAFKIVRRFLISRGFQTQEPVDHEDRIVRALPASAVRRIVVHPSGAFSELTGCDTWRNPLKTDQEIC